MHLDKCVTGEVKTAIRAARGPTVEKAGGSVQMKGSVRSVPMAKNLYKETCGSREASVR